MSADMLSLSGQLGEALLARKWTVTCAESCTGGGIGHAITMKAGSSAWFNQGFITYSNQAKSSLLQVQTSTLETVGAVSQQTVREMARGAARAANAEVAVSVSGIAGPDGGSDDKPVGTVWFGFYVDGAEMQERCVFNGDRDAVRGQAISFAMQKLIALLRQ